MFTGKYTKKSLTAVSTAAATMALVVFGGLAPWQVLGGPPKEERSPADATQEERIQADVQAEQALADAQAAAAAPGDGGGEEFVFGEVLLAFRPGVAAPQINAVRQSLAATKIKEFAQIGVHHWRLPPGLTVDQAVRALSANPNVQYAEPNYIVHTHGFPNDPRLGELWGLHNVGQTGGTLDADIDAPEVWDIQTGLPSVVVGVIDTGIDYNHEDLAANIWINPGETPGDGIDNDNNGYVDDVRGWDFANDDNDPMDDNGHGTHTAGTVGAEGDNGIGVVGVNWTVTLMPLKFLDASGSGTNADAIDAVLYAASFEDGLGNKIVRVTNNSWGGGRRSNALKQAIEASGALFVASAGNRSSSQKQYPAGYPSDNIISVAATDHNDDLAGFSNWSDSWVDLGAPGVAVLSSIPNNSYGLKGGTSMAAPHVAGGDRPGDTGGDRPGGTGRWGGIEPARGTGGGGVLRQFFSPGVILRPGGAGVGGFLFFLWYLPVFGHCSMFAEAGARNSCNDNTLGYGNPCFEPCLQALPWPWTFRNGISAVRAR